MGADFLFSPKQLYISRINEWIKMDKNGKTRATRGGNEYSDTVTDTRGARKQAVRRLAELERHPLASILNT